MDEKLKSNLTSGKHWLRLLYMIVFAVCLQVASFVMWVLVALQFLFSLIRGEDNENLRTFGASLSKYIFQALQFLTYNSEEKPFPFSDWPAADVVEEDAIEIEGDVEVAEKNRVFEPSEEVPETPAADEREDEREIEKVD